MIRDHSTIEELLAVQALGGLDGADVQALARERASHGDCQECARLEAEFAETAGKLAFSLEPVKVDASMADRILTRAKSEPLVAVPEATGDGYELAERRLRAGRGWQALVGIAAAFAIVVVAVSLFDPARTTSVTSASPTQTIATFSGTMDGELAVAYTPGRPGVVLWGSGLPDPEANEVYELWMIQDGEPVSGGCMRPQDGRLALTVDADLSGAESMAVTSESTACPSAPTGPSILAVDLTSV